MPGRTCASGYRAGVNTQVQLRTPLVVSTRKGQSQPRQLLGRRAYNRGCPDPRADNGSGGQSAAGGEPVGLLEELFQLVVGQSVEARQHQLR